MFYGLNWVGEGVGEVSTCLEGCVQDNRRKGRQYKVEGGLVGCFGINFRVFEVKVMSMGEAVVGLGQMWVWSSRDFALDVSRLQYSGSLMVYGTV